MNKKSEAIKNYKKAIKFDAYIPEAYNNLGAIYFDTNNFKKAEINFKKAIKLNPKYDGPYYHLGITYKRQEKYHEAISSINKHLELNPNNADAEAFLGNIYLNLGNFEQALEHYQKALQINPKFAAAHNDLGNLYKENSDYDKARECYENALKYDPSLHGAYNNLGVIHLNKEEYDKAISFFEKAIKLNPKISESYYHLGWIYIDKGILDLAVKYLKKSLKLNTQLADSLNLLVYALMRMCDFDEYDKYAKKLDALTKKELKVGKRTSETPFLNAIRKEDLKSNFDIAASWSRAIEKTVKDFEGFKHKIKHGRKIKIGYLSNDYWNHATAHLILGLFKTHDRDNFEIYAYSYGPNDGSFYRRELEKTADKFIDIKEINNLDAAKMIYKDGIDILVDLKGHTKSNRMEICAMRPAPIQINYLGFPGTVGSKFFDYIITDKNITPPSMSKFFSEKFIYMPDTYQINNIDQQIANTKYKRGDFNLPKNTFVFASFNHSQKFDKRTLDVWFDILKQVPNSILWLFKSHEVSERNIIKYATKCGIKPERIISSASLPKNEHLKRISLADLTLDPLTCNGHTTTSDSLWAGVPVLTLQGKHFASRVAASLVEAIGLPELIAKTEVQYIDLAVKIAKDKKYHRALKEKLNQNRFTKPLFKTKEFVANLEKGYKLIYENYSNGQEPKIFEVK